MNRTDVNTTQCTVKEKSLSTPSVSQILVTASQAGVNRMDNSSSMARFLELRGCRVFEGLGATWGHYRGPFYSSLPYHREFDFSRSEIRSMMWKARVGSVRFPTASRPGLPGGMYVCNPAEYSLEALSRQYRVQIKRGIEVCETRIIDTDELLAHGHQLNLDTMERQHRYDAEFGDPARWNGMVRAIRDCPEVVTYGAFVGGRLSAYIIGIQDSGWLHLLYKMTSNADRGVPVSHALDYFVIQNAAQDRRVQMIGNSFVSVLANEGLDQYKRKMGFAVAPHNVALHIHPAISALVTNKVAVSAAKKFWNMNPQSPRYELAARLLEGAQTTMSTQFALANAAVKDLDACQHTGCFEYARFWRPHFMFVLRSGMRRLRQDGIGAAIRKSFGFISSRVSPKPVVKKTVAPPDIMETLNLQPGDLVQIKTREEIEATLDAAGKHRGMAFVPTEMLSHCGKTYKVHKRVEKIFLEESKQNRKLKNTVLLDGVQCQGIGLDCDRSCFLFWRETWLKKVERPEA